MVTYTQVAASANHAAFPRSDETAVACGVNPGGKGLGTEDANRAVETLVADVLQLRTILPARAAVEGKATEEGFCLTFNLQQQQQRLHRVRSASKLAMQLVRGRTTSLALTERTPLNVYAHEGTSEQESARGNASSGPRGTPLTHSQGPCSPSTCAPWMAAASAWASGRRRRLPKCRRNSRCGMGAFSRDQRPPFG